MNEFIFEGGKCPEEVIKTTLMPSCEFGMNGCEGSCGVSNSQCGEIFETDVIYCGCLYCNYDPATQKCGGTCPSVNGGFNSINKCLNKVPTPQSDADCGCASCQKSTDAHGNITCSGTCLASGLTCRVGRVSAFNFLGYVEECFCH